MWSLVGAGAVVLVSWWLTRPSATNADGAVPSDGIPGGAALVIAVPLLLVVLSPVVPAVLRIPTVVVDRQGIAVRPLVWAKHTPWDQLAAVWPPSAQGDGRRGIPLRRVDGTVWWLDWTLFDLPLREVHDQIVWFCEDFGIDLALRQAGDDEGTATCPSGSAGEPGLTAGLGVLGVVRRMIR